MYGHVCTYSLHQRVTIIVKADFNYYIIQNAHLHMKITINLICLVLFNANEVFMYTDILRHTQYVCVPATGNPELFRAEILIPTPFLDLFFMIVVYMYVHYVYICIIRTLNETLIIHRLYTGQG